MAESCQSMDNLLPLHLPLSPSSGSYRRVQPLVTLPSERGQAPPDAKEQSKSTEGAEQTPVNTRTRTEPTEP